MLFEKCPGQDTRFWQAEDIFETSCPKCGQKVEIWKDEQGATCPACRTKVKNPRLDLGCAAWCAVADQCEGVVNYVKARLFRLVPSLYPASGTAESVLAHMQRGEKLLSGVEAGVLMVLGALALSALPLDEINEEHLKNIDFPPQRLEETVLLARMLVQNDPRLSQTAEGRLAREAVNPAA